MSVLCFGALHVLFLLLRSGLGGCAGSCSIGSASGGCVWQQGVACLLSSLSWACSAALCSCVSSSGCARHHAVVSLRVQCFDRGISCFAAPCLLCSAANDTGCMCSCWCETACFAVTMSEFVQYKCRVTGKYVKHPHMKPFNVLMVGSSYSLGWSELQLQHSNCNLVQLCCTAASCCVCSCLYTSSVVGVMVAALFHCGRQAHANQAAAKAAAGTPVVESQSDVWSLMRLTLAFLLCVFSGRHACLRWKLVHVAWCNSTKSTATTVLLPVASSVI